MTIVGVSFLFVSTALGAALVFCFQKEPSRKYIALFLGVTSGIMLAASVWSLILPALQELENEWGRYAFIPISAGVLLGAFFLWSADKFLPITKEGKQNNAILKNPLKLFFAITLHNIPEGLAVGFAFGVAWTVKTQSAFAVAAGLALGIGIQNIPEGAAVSLPISVAMHSKRKAFFYGMTSGICEAIFAAVGIFLSVFLRSFQPWLLAFSAGTMIFVVVEDLLPSANSVEVCNKDGIASSLVPSSLVAWGVMVGFILMMGLDIAFG